ncbi:MAG TPA: sulfotransferase [Gemmatimonadota bacterium]|jgi:hypothetical protein
MRWGNAIGGALARVGIRASLSEQSLLRDARRIARLSDFGDEDFRAPLARVLEALEEGDWLSPVGRVLKRIDIVDMLANRLRVQREIEERPSILDDPVRSPLIVTGLPRTGTTLLQRLLSLAPGARPLLAWEAMWPAPIRRRRDGRDVRIRRTRRLVWLARRALPGIDRMHPLDPTGPEECTRLLDGSFRWSYFAIELSLPRYADWLEGLGPEAMDPAYRWYARQLQVLQGQKSETGRWVLKSPAHVGNLRSLLRVIPNARIVVAWRDPREAVASACSLFTFLYGATAHGTRPERIGRGVAKSLSNALARGLEVAAEDPARVRVARYEELVRAPVETLRSIHAGFGLPFSAELEVAARDWLAANPQGRHGTHRYDLATYGLDEETVGRLFEKPEEILSRIG